MIVHAVILLMFRGISSAICQRALKITVRPCGRKTVSIVKLVHDPAIGWNILCSGCVWNGDCISIEIVRKFSQFFAIGSARERSGSGRLVNYSSILYEIPMILMILTDELTDDCKLSTLTRIYHHSWECGFAMVRNEAK